MDLASAEAVETYLQRIQPSPIVNAAAWTAVDAAEEHHEAAFRLAEQTAYANAQYVPLVHYSSDYVYPSDGETPWREYSPTAPLSVYGASELAGDEAIQTSGARHLIFRTSWVYYARGNNFLKTMLRPERERDALKVVADQVGAPHQSG